MIEIKANREGDQVIVDTNFNGNDEDLFNEAYSLITAMFEDLYKMDEKVYSALLAVMAEDTSWAALDMTEEGDEASDRYKS